MSSQTSAAELVRPWWRKARLWFALAAAIVVGGVLVGTLSEQPGRLLDPTSAHKNGGQAAVRLLERFGATVATTDRLSVALSGAQRAVLVVDPDAYSSAQLRELASTVARLVLVAPGSRAVSAAFPGMQPTAGFAIPWASCGDLGASAAGKVAFPADTRTYLPGTSGATSCFGGALLTTPQLAVLGSASLLRNDHLADRGVAALDINAITDSRRFTSVVWLMPGADAAGSGPASIWNLFPSGAYRVFWWLLAVGVLLAIWRARRLGGVVPEPLPVIVRSAEAVEGHGRLYARAGDRGRASAVLRSGAVHRLGRRLGLPRGATAEQVAVALAPALGRSPSEILDLLAGPAPVDDRALTMLGRELDRLERVAEGMRGS